MCTGCKWHPRRDKNHFYFFLHQLRLTNKYSFSGGVATRGTTMAIGHGPTGTWGNRDKIALMTSSLHKDGPTNIFRLLLLCSFQSKWFQPCAEVVKAVIISPLVPLDLPFETLETVIKRITIFEYNKYCYKNSSLLRCICSIWANHKYPGSNGQY